MRAELVFHEVAAGEFQPCEVGDLIVGSGEEGGGGDRQAGHGGDFVVVEWQVGCGSGDESHAADEGGDCGRFEVAGSHGAGGEGTEGLGLLGERGGVVKAVGADVDDNAKVAAPGNFHPTNGDGLAFFEGEGGTFAGGAANEGMTDAGFEEVGGLGFDDGEIERSVWMERGVGGGDEAGDFHKRI